MVLAGVIAYSTGNGVKDEDEEAAREAAFRLRLRLQGGGIRDECRFRHFRLRPPAYMFTALDALADAGVAMGLSRKTALGLAAETMRGASLMLERTGKHPMALRMRSLPGGTTIAALNALDECGFRNAWIQAVKAPYGARRKWRSGNGCFFWLSRAGFLRKRTAWWRAFICTGTAFPSASSAPGFAG